MPNSQDGKTLEEKYDELLRAFRSVMTKVNNNEKRNVERFSKLEKSIDLLENKIGEVNEQDNIGIDELEKRKKKMENDLVTIDKKLEDINCKIEQQTKTIKKFQEKKEMKGDMDKDFPIYSRDICHQTEPFNCRICLSSYITKQQLRNHIKEEHKTKDHKCSYCDSTFESFLHLERHIQESHDNEAVKCDECDLKFYTSWQLKKHTKVHQNLKVRNCHYYNSDKECPFAAIGCKFKHVFSENCKFQDRCKMDKCQFRHTKSKK